MFPRRQLHSVQFMTLDVVEHDQMFCVRSFQRMLISQVIIHPDRELSRRKLMLDLDFQHCWRRCRRNRRGTCALHSHRFPCRCRNFGNRGDRPRAWRTRPRSDLAWRSSGNRLDGSHSLVGCRRLGGCYRLSGCYSLGRCHRPVGARWHLVAAIRNYLNSKDDSRQKKDAD